MPLSEAGCPPAVAGAQATHARARGRARASLGTNKLARGSIITTGAANGCACVSSSLTRFCEPRQPGDRSLGGGGRLRSRRARIIREEAMGQDRNTFFNGAFCCGHSHMGGFPSARLARREFLAGGGAVVALSTLGPPEIMRAARAQANPHRIDVHHHVSPPSW